MSYIPSTMKSLILNSTNALQTAGAAVVPTLFVEVGETAVQRYLEFFTANIRNRNTRESYARAVTQFAWWCEQRGIKLSQLTPVIVAAYIEQLSQEVEAPTVKQHLAAIRMLFDYLVIGQVMLGNPAASVRGPKHVVTKGKTPVLTAEETRQLLDAIDDSKIAGLRDRALIGIMVFSFARIGAVLKMNVGDYFPVGKRWNFRLHEKGGKHHEVPVHHKADEYVDAYIEAAGIGQDKKGPLFRSLNRQRHLTERRLHRREALAMIKRRARQAGLPDTISCHTFRATGITTYLKNDGKLEIAQYLAAHASARTTKLYDRREDEVSLDEIERIII